jgi:hypothetical protein
VTGIKIQMSLKLNNPTSLIESQNQPHVNLNKPVGNGELANSSTAGVGQDLNGLGNMSAGMAEVSRLVVGQNNDRRNIIGEEQLVFGQGKSSLQKTLYGQGNSDSEVKTGMRKVVEALKTKGCAPITYRKDDGKGTVTKSGVIMSAQFINLLAKKVGQDSQQSLGENSGNNPSQFFSHHLDNAANTGNGISFGNLSGVGTDINTGLGANTGLGYGIGNGTSWWIQWTWVCCI